MDEADDNTKYDDPEGGAHEGGRGLWNAKELVLNNPELELDPLVQDVKP